MVCTRQGKAVGGKKEGTLNQGSARLKRVLKKLLTKNLEGVSEIQKVEIRRRAVI